MIKKAARIKALDDFPEAFSLDDLIDKMLLIQKVERGLAQSKANEVVSDKEARERMAKMTATDSR